MHPANTGNEINRRNDVKNIVQGNNGINNALVKTDRQLAFNDDIIKLIEPNNELNPAKCKENIRRSMKESPMIHRGTYSVQPLLMKPNMKDNDIRNNELNITQKLNAFNRGNIISLEQRSKGNNRLPKPPINIGRTIFKRCQAVFYEDN